MKIINSNKFDIEDIYNLYKEENWLSFNNT